MFHKFIFRGYVMQIWLPCYGSTNAFTTYFVISVHIFCIHSIGVSCPHMELLKYFIVPLLFYDRWLMMDTNTMQLRHSEAKRLKHKQNIYQHIYQPFPLSYFSPLLCVLRWLYRHMLSVSHTHTHTHIHIYNTYIYKCLYIYQESCIFRL